MPPEATDPKPAADAADKPETFTRDDVAAMVNSAVTSHLKRAQAATEKLIAESIGKALAAAPKPEAADAPAADGKGKPAESADAKLMREKLEKLEAKYAEAEARAKATEEKARRDAARADLRAALEAKGVKGAKAAALVSHLEATGAVRFTEDGKPELVVKRSRSKGAAAEELAFDLAAGVEDWSKTPDAAEFLPAPTTPAGRPGQAAPTGPRRAAQTYATPATSDAEMARRAAESLAAQGVDVLEAYRR